MAKTADARGVFIVQVQAAAADIGWQNQPVQQAGHVAGRGGTAVAAFKHYVEHQDGYLLINRGGGQGFATEKEVQAFFGLLLAPSRFDVCQP